MKLSVFTDILVRPFDEALDAFAALGFDTIDLRSKIGPDNVDTLAGAAAQRVGKAIDRRKLSVGCVASWGVNPMKGGYDANDPAYRQLMRDRTAHLARLAEQVGARNVRVYSFPRPPAGQPITEARRADNAAFLSELADICARRGRGLVIENEPPSLTATCAELGELMRRKTAANLKVNWDIVNGWRAGEIPWADGVFEHIAGHVAHIHVKGAKADPAGQFASMAVPGADDVPHEEILRRLTSSGFDGIITIDPHYDQFADADRLDQAIEPVLEVVRLSKAYLEGLLGR